MISLRADHSPTRRISRSSGRRFRTRYASRGCRGNGRHGGRGSGSGRHLLRGACRSAQAQDLDEHTGELIHYHRADTAEPRASRYRIAPTSDPLALKTILEQVLPVTGSVRKRRSVYHVGQTRIHLDQVEGLGDFWSWRSSFAPISPKRRAWPSPKTYWSTEDLPRPARANGVHRPPARPAMTRLRVKVIPGSDSRIRRDVE